SELMFSHHNRMTGVLCAVVDALLTFVSFFAAEWIRLHLTGLRPLYPVWYYLWILPVLPALWVGSGWVTGLYRNAQDQHSRRALTGPARAALIATVLLFAFISVFKLEYISRSLLGLYCIVDLALMMLFRRALGRSLSRLGASAGGLRHFLLVGAGAEAFEIARTIEANAKLGMRLSGFVVMENRMAVAEPVDRVTLQRSYPAFELRELPELLRRRVIDEVIFAVSKEELAQLEDAFLLCEQEGVKTRLSLSFFPHIISRVSLEHLREMPLLTFSTTPENEYFMLFKRLADFLMAALLVVLLSPVFLLLAALIWFTSGGPILYRQTRCGLSGRKFTLFKFRSMRAGADLLKSELEYLNEMNGPVFKIENDPRCTRAGRWMRKLSLDELPQLFNILKGDMSFVGPRPPLPAEVERYECWQRRRLRMQPGLTCLWALEGRNRLDFKRWMELDLEYIDHWSPLLDWKILIKTIPVVLLGRGAS
ncbi:MAG: sugar transferase, partial [Terriglobia bacterium]